MFWRQGVDLQFLFSSGFRGLGFRVYGIFLIELIKEKARIMAITVIRLPPLLGKKNCTKASSNTIETRNKSR